MQGICTYILVLIQLYELLKKYTYVEKIKLIIFVKTLYI